MGRYFVSFIVSGVLYSALIVSLLFAVNNDEKKICHKKMEHMNKVAVSLIAQQSHAQKTPTPKKEIKKKQEPKKVVQKSKPKPKPIVKEIVKKEPIEKPKEIIEEVVQEEQETIEEVVQEEVVDDQEMQRQIEQMMVAKEQELDHFTKHLIKKINDNKRYPMSARRRGIEGDVDVKFMVMANGGVSSIKVLKGKKIFKRSTYEAIENSFPVDVSNTILEFPQEFQIKLVYLLK
jgi:periplasmic protein TonB